jgi:hypothetical protein
MYQKGVIPRLTRNPLKTGLLIIKGLRVEPAMTEWSSPQ